MPPWIATHRRDFPRPTERNRGKADDDGGIMRAKSCGIVKTLHLGP